MKIVVGSTNAVKVAAVREIVPQYEFLSGADIASMDVSSGISEQPKSLEETMTGAMNRARQAFQDCRFSIGIEDGLMRIPHTKTGFMNVCVCAIYDGSQFHFGLSSAFEYPKEVARLVVEEGLDINQAFLRTGLTAHPRVGSAEGAIGVLTKGRLPRKEYTKQAVQMALIHLEHRHHY